MGTVAYSAQYQQRPAPLGGIIFQPNWWRYWQTLPSMDTMILSVDCAFKDLKTSDYVAIHVYGFVGPRTYLLHRVNDHLGYTATKQAIRSLLEYYRGHISHVLIEDAANGPAVIEEMKREFPGIIPIHPMGGKIARAQASTADLEAGNVYLPEQADWTLPFVQVFSKFPAVRNDDDIDAFSQAINWKRSRIDYSMFSTPINVYQGVRA
jgi:predicted phage terminase large subunit-like protein